MKIKTNTTSVFIGYLDELLKLYVLVENEEEKISKYYLKEKISRAIAEIPIVLHMSLLGNLRLLRVMHGVELPKEFEEEIEIGNE